MHHSPRDAIDRTTQDLRGSDFAINAVNKLIFILPQVFSPYHRKWVSELNDNVDVHLRDYTFDHSNPPSVKASEAFSFMFNGDIPDHLPKLELCLEQKELMADIWPAGEEAADAVG